VTALAAGAEHAGAGGVWVSDHLFWPKPTTECLTTIAVAASATRRVVVGSCVLQLPLRAPAATAKQAAALQVLSGGRFILGVGSGIHASEYDLAGAAFHHRGRDLDSGIAALHAAWHGNEELGGYRLAPAPPVPVWVGGSSAAALRRAATVGDGWVPLFIGPEKFAASLSHLRDLASDSSRDPDDIVPAAVMVTVVDEDGTRGRAAGGRWLSRLYGIPPKAFERHLVAGSAAHCAEVAAAYVDAGAAQVIVLVAADDALEQFCALAAACEFFGPGEQLEGRARFFREQTCPAASGRHSRVEAYEVAGVCG
jgi:alkanesulfonate monooxygenase SsuD/methylene tetrahydromethanopterin reductase-like flavin-dependent oxidoreductase (luciferase family)